MKTKFGTLKFLIDTGENKNYISPALVPTQIIKSCPNQTVRNISGTHRVNQFCLFNPFSDFCKVPYQKFYLFNFHNYFHGLIGYETLRSLGAVIDTPNDHLIIENKTIPLQRKHLEAIDINAHETKPVTLATSLASETSFKKTKSNFCLKSKFLPDFIKVQIMQLKFGYIITMTPLSKLMFSIC